MLLYVLTFYVCVIFFLYRNRTRCAGLIGNGVCDMDCNTVQCPFDTKDCARQVYVSVYVLLMV